MLQKPASRNVYDLYQQNLLDTAFKIGMDKQKVVRKLIIFIFSIQFTVIFFHNLKIAV